MAETKAKFSFHFLGGREFQSIDCKETQELFLKWSMKGRLVAQAFSFDQAFQAYEKDEFTLAFFQDPEVVHHLKVVSSSGSLVPLGTAAKSVSVDQIPCTQLSMSFFDRLQENNIVRESGRITKCFDAPCDDFFVSDELRKVLLIEDSDNYDIFSESDREEFLFLLFQHICLGGSVCQYEDSIEPYLSTTKLIYKDLISVQKDSSSGEFHIVSSIFKVSASDEAGVIYPSDADHLQNFAYLIVHPLKRNVYVLYHCFGAYCSE